MLNHQVSEFATINQNHFVLDTLCVFLRTEFYIPSQSLGTLGAEGGELRLVPHRVKEFLDFDTTSMALRLAA